MFNRLVYVVPGAFVMCAASYLFASCSTPAPDYLWLVLTFLCGAAVILIGLRDWDVY